MTVLHFSTRDLDGGAAKASYRLHAALRGAGLSSRMIVRYKQSTDDDVQQVLRLSTWQARVHRVKQRLPLVDGALPTAKYYFACDANYYSFDSFNFDVEPDIDTTSFFSHQPWDVDVIGLHYIAGLLQARHIKDIYDYYRRPIVWTPMDQEPVTGGCHYSGQCSGYTRQCGRCPILNTAHPRQRDRSRTVWQHKATYLQDLPITFAAPTTWVAERIHESSLFRTHRVEIIPLALDTTVFRPFDQRAARDLLHVPWDKKVIFFGSMSLKDPRKGTRYLLEALRQLPSLLAGGDGPVCAEDVFLLVAGHQSQDLASSLPFPSRQLGYLKDDVTLALAYQAADLFVCPSTEDAGPMMIPEAMLCGTPVVAFAAGGAPDALTTMKTGYLAAYKDSADMARGIYAILSQHRPQQMRAATHEAAAARHAPSVVAARYRDLYASLCGQA
jgi:glycosyltransferase involved in cell wall biosynthesis